MLSPSLARKLCPHETCSPQNLNTPKGIKVRPTSRSDLCLTQLSRAHTDTVMGYRHQAFLIARVPQDLGGHPRYRCVAAYHHQWCYGDFPLLAIRRFLTLVKQKENAEIVIEELLGINSEYGEKPGTRDVPCPFAAALLGMSWDTDLSTETPYVSGITFEGGLQSADTDCWHSGASREHFHKRIPD